MPERGTDMGGGGREPVDGMTCGHEDLLERMFKVVHEVPHLAPQDGDTSCDFCGWVDDDFPHEDCAAMEAVKLVEAFDGRVPWAG